MMSISKGRYVLFRLRCVEIGRYGIGSVHRMFSTDEYPKVPTQARVCIIGGGVIGCSVSYHLAKLGWKDIVLLERSQLSSGTTWHAAGLIGQLRDTETETKLSGVYGTKLLRELETETGLSTGFKACGSLTLASNANRLTQLKIRAAKARSFGIESEILTPAEAKELYPYLYIDDLHAALWLPGDGSAVSSDVTQALARGARMHSDNGVRIVENCRVNAITTSSGEHGPKRVTAVHTEHGDIKCDVVVNCAGLWARRVGQMCGVSVPLASAEHFYIYSRPFQPSPVSSMLPILRDPDAYIYYREWSGGLLMGGFEPTAKPAFTTSTGPPEDFSFSLLPEDWDHFEILMNGALHRTPCLGDAQVKMINGPESFTPDNQYILGEAPEVKGFYVAAGFNSSGIASSGGAGKALAEWIVNDGPTMDLWTVDIRRFSSQVHNNTRFLSSRVAETLGLHYQITWPKRELMTGRGLRRSPLYEHYRRKGACFGSKFGWERVNFFAPKDHPSVTKAESDAVSAGSAGGVNMEPYTYGRQWWFDAVGREHMACREGVALFDITSFSKILIQGPQALELLQDICVNNMDVPVGKLVYTTMCNDRGGIESDLTFCRLGPEKFLAITATSQATRDMSWMQSHINRDGTSDRFVILTDVTSSEAVFSLMGPLARQLLSSLTSADLSDEHFPFNTSATIDVGYVNVRAHRISYVGEQGYELYVPTESAVSLYESLHEAAALQQIPLTNAGYFAIDSCRLEKGYRAWGHDITPNDTPLEAGLGFAIAWDKPVEFIGKAALAKQKAEGVRRRLVSVKFECEDIGDKHPYPYGGEPLLRNGKLVGYLTSAGYGYSLQRAVGLAYIRGSPSESGHLPAVVDAPFVRDGQYEVLIADKLHKVSVSLKPFFDPKGSRMSG